tara:strand:- start:269 stop:907 length:639 start_codon:yes stop_codon:yes gene_type:complete
MSEPFPAFAVPLSEDRLVLLGKIAAVFSQIDYMMAEIEKAFLRLGVHQYDLLLAEKATSSRLSALSSGCSFISDQTKCEAVSNFVAKMKTILPRRNQIIHGCWGEFTHDYKNFKVGPYSAIRPMARLYEDELDQLYADLCEASWLAIDARNAVRDEAADDKHTEPARIIWTTADGPPSEGEWLAGSVALRVPDPTRDRNFEEARRRWIAQED